MGKAEVAPGAVGCEYRASLAPYSLMGEGGAPATTGTPHISAIPAPLSLLAPPRETAGGPWCVRRGESGSWWEPQALASAVLRLISLASTPASPPSWTGSTSRWRWVQPLPTSSWCPHSTASILPGWPCPAVQSQAVIRKLWIQHPGFCSWVSDVSTAKALGSVVLVGWVHTGGT